MKVIRNDTNKRGKENNNSVVLNFDELFKILEKQKQTEGLKFVLYDSGGISLSQPGESPSSIIEIKQNGNGLLIRSQAKDYEEKYILKPNMKIKLVGLHNIGVSEFRNALGESEK